MAIESLKWYLHDDYEVSEMREEIKRTTGIELPDTGEVTDNLRFSPFYEVGFNATIDTETGEMKIVGLLP